MRLWRISSEKWALDKTGKGAAFFGGRWNPIGWPALYAGTTIEIAALEKYVNLSGLVSVRLVLVSIDIPDQNSFYLRPELTKLPADWATVPFGSASQKFGKEWLKACKQLVMFVPSVIVPEATNAVINPGHPAISELKLKIEREFKFDSRMISNDLSSR